MSSLFLQVPMKVAMNPVAQAIARVRLQTAIRDMLVDCYLMEDGAEEVWAYTTAGAALTVAIACAEKLGVSDGMAELQEAHARCVAGSERGFVWRKEDAGPLDAGLHIAAQVVALASPRMVAKAYQEMQREAA